MEVGSDIPKEHIEIFISEAEEQIEVWEERALALERDPANLESLNDLFRAIHTLKGSAGFVGRNELTDLAHELETVIERAREGQQELDAASLEVVFEGLDATRHCVGSMKEGEDPDFDFPALIAKVRRCSVGEAGTSSTDDADIDDGCVDEADRPSAPPLTADAHTYRLEIEINADESEAYLRAVLIESKLEDSGEIIEMDPPPDEIKQQGGVYRMLVSMRSALGPEDLRRAADIDQVTVLSVIDTTEGDAGSLTKSTVAVDSVGGDGRRQPKRMEEVVRVHVGKLDSMMNLVGELVVANSGFISILAEGREKYGNLDVLEDLKARTDSLAQIARNLQDTVTRVSMLPVSTIFSRFHRVVRDLAKHSGKDVELEMFGEKTEIDKRILDGIAEPLIHLLRNAIDHGIEMPDDRITFGKEATGTIRIGAFQEGDHICVVLSDDGIGIDRQAVVTKAISRGVIDSQQAERLSESEVFDLLFTPGFSTAKEVTDISGRGMGLDIVKKTVEDLGGSVRVESTFGLGTTTTITLPLTTVIINSLVVECGGSIYAFPMSSVLEMIQPSRSEIRSVQNGRVICLREDVVPVFDLLHVLWPQSVDSVIPIDDRDAITIIILAHNNGKVGFIVDSLMGKQEIVVKSLSRNYQETEGLMGATIMGTGKVGLILDVKGLMGAYYREHGGTQDVTDVAPVAQPIKPSRRPEIEVKQPSIVVTPPPPEPKGLVLSTEEADQMQTIMLEGAINASESMTELLGRDIRVSFPELKVVSLDSITEAFGGDEAVIAGIFVEFSGDISGVWALLIAVEETKGLSDYLMGRSLGTTEQIASTEVSALKEMGNILTAAFIRSIVDATDLDVQLMVPEMSVDMCLAVMDSVVVRFNQPGNQILVTEAELFSMETQSQICNLMILMENESTAKLVESLSAGPKGLLARAREWRRTHPTDSWLAGTEVI